MQTFLPYKSFESSAKVLDRQRLGKQRVETMQIMSALVQLQVPHARKGPNIPWANHPAALMWQGHEHTLMEYQIAMCLEWTNRGYNDTCLDKTADIFSKITWDTLEFPKWIGLKSFHSAHRANLLRKDPEHYGKFGWSETPQEGYWWPTQEMSARQLRG